MRSCCLTSSRRGVWQYILSCYALISDPSKQKHVPYALFPGFTSFCAQSWTIYKWGLDSLAIVGCWCCICLIREQLQANLLSIDISSDVRMIMFICWINTLKLMVYIIVASLIYVALCLILPIICFQKIYKLTNHLSTLEYLFHCVKMCGNRSNIKNFKQAWISNQKWNRNIK